LGLGIYNYFVDTLPTIVKLLRFLIALPGGSRQAGLEQLHRVIAEGDLTVSDARFQLAKDYSRYNERQYAKSLELFQGLAHDYPGNPLWTLLIGSLECRLDRPQPCEAAYRDVLKQTPGEQSEVKRAVHAAAVTALQRLHPDEKVE
jgi:predicted Zn-dependent protease